MNNKFLNKEVIKASILGFIVGDALGVPVEFESRDYLKNNPILTMEEYGTHYQPKGTWSDDSSMVLATMMAIVKEKSDNLDEILNSIATPFGVVFDIGGATSAAINNFKRDKNILTCGLKDEYQNGNGSLMRIIPVAFYGLKMLDDEQFNNFIFKASSLTHAHNYSKLACLIYSKYIEFLLEKNDSRKSYLKLQDYFKKFKKLNPKYTNDLKEFANILDRDISKLQENDINSSGFVIDTLEAVFFSILTTNSYKEAVLRAINLGDDTDTIGALTGGLASIIYGIKEIPDEWINALQKKDYIIDLINSFNDKILGNNKISFNIKLLEETIKDLETNPKACTLTENKNNNSNVIILKESIIDEQLHKFIKYLYDTNKFVKNYTQIELSSIKISEMSYNQVLTKLTYIIRGDRFSSGLLYSYVKNGEFLELLLRLKKIINDEVNDER